MNAWLMEQFPAKHRLTSAALGYDLAHCTASAFSPLVDTVLVQEYGNLAPAAMYPFFALMALLGMFLRKKAVVGVLLITVLGLLPVVFFLPSSMPSDISVERRVEVDQYYRMLYHNSG